MLQDYIASLLGKKKNEPFLSVDIGTSAVKLMVLEQSGKTLKLLGAGSAPTPASSIHNNVVTKPEQIGNTIRAIIEANDLFATKATVSIPGPCAFTKKITIGYAGLEELNQNLRFEAGNYIPHSIDDVALDFQVISTNGKSTLEVLLVAVKNDIVNSYVSAIECAGLEPAIADIDYFALENMFEINYPEEMKKTVALVNVGARYSSVNLYQNGNSIFTGDVGVGARLYTDALCEALGMQPKEAEGAKSGIIPDGYDEHLIRETIERTTDHLAGELHRQIGFFWNAAATEQSIEAIYLCGGGAQIPGLLTELGTKTGMNCSLMDCFRKVEWSDSFDREYIEEINSSMGVSVGLAARRFGDKVHAYED